MAEPVALEAPDVADHAGQAPLSSTVATQQPPFPAKGVIIASHTGALMQNATGFKGGSQSALVRYFSFSAPITTSVGIVDGITACNSTRGA